MVTNLSFLVEVIMNSVPYTNITSSMSVINLCILYKSNVIVAYSSVFTLVDLCFTFFPLTPYNYGPKMYLSLVMYFVNIGQLGRSLLITVSLYLRTEG